MQNKCKNNITSMLMALPVMVLVSFCVFGIFICICEVFTNNVGLGANSSSNYISSSSFGRVLNNPEFLKSFLYTFYIAFTQSAISLVMAIAVSYYEILKSVNSKLLYVPISIPHIVVAMIAIYLFAKNGLISHILHSVRIIREAYEFPALINDKYGIGIILPYVFKGSAYSLSIIYLAMKKLHNECYEESKVLGCDNKKYLLDILLPQLNKTICFCFLITFVYAFGAYEIPFLLGNTQYKILPILSYIEYTKPDINARVVSQSYNIVMLMVGILSMIVYAYIVGDSSAKKIS